MYLNVKILDATNQFFITIAEFLNLEAINEDNPYNIDDVDIEIDETGNVSDNFIDDEAIIDLFQFGL